MENRPLLAYQSRELGSAGMDPVLSPGNKENRHAGCTRAHGCCVMLDKPRRALPTTRGGWVTGRWEWSVVNALPGLSHGDDLKAWVSASIPCICPLDGGCSVEPSTSKGDLEVDSWASQPGPETTILPTQGDSYL